MKRLIYIVCAAAASLMALSCGPKVPPSSDEPKDPVFPAAISKDINPGESVNISFTADRDWELSIPRESLAWFYIDDNGMKEYKVKGSKGNVTVSVHAENVENNYERRSCVVTLKMGGKSADIATISLVPQNRTISIFEANTDADGRFVVVGSGEYEYKSTKSDALSLLWPKGLSSFSLPIKVESNFEWAVKNDHPQWLELTKTTSEGDVTTLVLKGVPSEYPMDQASGKISFTDLKTGEVIYQAEVTIPGCKDIVYTDLAGSRIDLNILGEYDSNGAMMSSYSFHLTSTLETEVFVVEKNGSSYVRPENPWLNVKIGYPEGQPSENVIQDRIVNLSAGQNIAPERTAYVIAVPGYVLESSDINSIAAKYTVAEVRQAGLDPESGWNAIVPVNSEFQMAIKGAGIHRTASSEAHYAELSSKFGTNEIYTLEYNNWFSYEGAELLSQKEIADVKYYLADGSDENYDGNLSVVNNDSERKDVFNVNIEYFEEGLEEAVVLYDNAGKVIAVILCRLSENYWPDVKFTDIRFVAYDLVGEDGDPDGNILPQNVLLEKLSSGEIYDQYKSYGIPVWRLVYYTRTSERNAMIYVPPFPMGSEDAIERHPEPSWMNVEGALSEKGLPYIHVTMNDKLPETGNVGHIVLRGGGRPLFVLVCEREFMNN
ncbi:MAG: hypothetical protein MJY72_05275 [Bacteroidales bacterium]|nr:hypothetical protein [Bacteroidales bacterium]